MHLVRQAAGGDDRDFEIFGIAFDGPAQRLAKLAAAREDGNCSTPICSGTIGTGQSVSCGIIIDSGEKQPWSNPVLEERHVELVGDEAGPDMVRKAGMTLHRRQRAPPAAFIGDFVFVVDTKREGRIMIEEKRGDVVVIGDENNVRLFLGHPIVDRLVGVEDRLPDGVGCLFAVVREADDRRMGCRAPMILAICRLPPFLAFTHTVEAGWPPGEGFPPFEFIAPPSRNSAGPRLTETSPDKADEADTFCAFHFAVCTAAPSHPQRRLRRSHRRKATQPVRAVARQPDAAAR